MSTFNGFGTIYYGWKHNEDSTAEATRWVVALFLPLVPLGRYRLRIVNDPDDEATVSLTGLLSVGGEGFVQDGYEILQKLPLDGASVAKTYFRAYVLLPLALGAPLAVALWLMSRLGDCLGDDPGMPELALMLAPLLVWFGYFFALAATLIHRARGGRR